MPTYFVPPRAVTTTVLPCRKRVRTEDRSENVCEVECERDHQGQYRPPCSQKGRDEEGQHLYATERAVERFGIGLGVCEATRINLLFSSFLQLACLPWGSDLCPPCTCVPLDSFHVSLFPLGFSDHQGCTAFIRLTTRLTSKNSMRSLILRCASSASVDPREGKAFAVPAADAAAGASA